MMTTTGKSYEVKDWFANKIANEMQKNISMCNVFCILKETEKAVYAIINCGCDCRKTMWVPKSVLVENEIGEDAVTSINHYETLKSDSYDEAVEAFKNFWNDFK